MASAIQAVADFTITGLPDMAWPELLERTRVLECRTILLCDTLAQLSHALVQSGDALALRVDVWAQTASGEEQHSELLRSGEQKAMALPLDGDGQLRYRWEVRRIGAAGEALVRSGEGATDLLVVQAG